MTDSPQPPAKSPSEILAESIAEKLLASGLLPAERKAEVAEKLAKGTATEADWNLWLDPMLIERGGGE